MAEDDAPHGLQQRVHELADLSRTIREEIEDEVDWREAVRAATDLPDVLRKEADQAASLRARVVDRHYREQRLTLAALADEMDVEPARVSQLRARAKKEAQHE